MLKISPLLLLLAASLPLQSQQLSDEARISLLTIAPGEELYSAFGHSAVRVHDPRLGLDRVYNYGTFDFDPPGFYGKFVLGKLNYRLDIEGFGRFERVYHFFRRSYREQEFNLSAEQRQALFNFLEVNYLPENRYYLYDFFFDNCATRIRDILGQVLGDSLRLRDPDAAGDSTFRDLLDVYLQDRPWPDFGIDLALGATVDRQATYSERMFLPDYLAAELSRAQVLRGGQPQPLVLRDEWLYEAPAEAAGGLWWLSPWAIWGTLLLALGLATWLGIRRGRWRRGLDVLLFSVSGLSGAILLFFWLCTDHKPAIWNLNVLWLLPTHLFFAWLLLRRKVPGWLRYYFMGSGALTALLLAGWLLLPQALNPAFIPWMLMLVLRSGRLSLALRSA
jgi:hypothetical protein